MYVWVFYHVPKMCIIGQWHVWFVLVWLCVGIAMEGHPVQCGFLPWTLSCWDRLCPHKTLNWNKQVGKSLSYLFVQIFLRCACSSHLFYSLVLEVFLVWVYIWKLDVLLDVTRNMLLELNSSLHHLAYGKTGFVIHCFASSCSFQEPILDIEDLLYYVSGP